MKGVVALMERRIELNFLLDFYGPLLTESRARVMRLYCEEDLSLQEIADSMGITRQAVHDAIGRASEQLEQYERKLGMAQRYKDIHAATRDAMEHLKGVRTTNDTHKALERALESLDRIEWIEG